MQGGRSYQCVQDWPDQAKPACGWLPEYRYHSDRFCCAQTNLCGTAGEPPSHHGSQAVGKKSVQCMAVTSRGPSVSFGLQQLVQGALTWLLRNPSALPFLTISQRRVEQQRLRTASICDTGASLCIMPITLPLKRLICLLIHAWTRHAALSASSALDGLVIRNEPGTWFSLKVCISVSQAPGACNVM